MLFHKELSKFEELQIFCKSLSQKIKSEKGHSRGPYVRWEEGEMPGGNFYVSSSQSFQSRREHGEASGGHRHVDTSSQYKIYLIGSLRLKYN